MEIFGQMVKTTSRQMVGNFERGSERVYHDTTLLLKDGLPFMESGVTGKERDYTFFLYAGGQCELVETDGKPEDSDVALQMAALERDILSPIVWEYEEGVENSRTPAPWVCTHGQQSTYLFGAEPVVSIGPDNQVVVWNERLVPKMVAGGYLQLLPFAKKKTA